MSGGRKVGSSQLAVSVADSRPLMANHADLLLHSFFCVLTFPPVHLSVLIAFTIALAITVAVPGPGIFAVVSCALGRGFRESIFPLNSRS